MYKENISIRNTNEHLNVRLVLQSLYANGLFTYFTQSVSPPPFSTDLRTMATQSLHYVLYIVAVPDKLAGLRQGEGYVYIYFTYRNPASLSVPQIIKTAPAH